MPGPLPYLGAAAETTSGYARTGRSADAWQQSLAERWIKLHLSSAPPSTSNYTELKDPMTLRGGEEGKVERYLLEVGGLKEEIEVLEQAKA